MDESDKTEKPSRKKAVLFLAFTLLLSAGIIVWNFYIDRGEIEVNGKFPFTISVGKIHDFLCDKPPCELRLKPKKYTLTAKKQDYFDFSRQIEIKRWKKIEIEAAFEFIPVIKELGELKFPFRAEKINSTDVLLDFDWQKIDITKIPKNAKRIIFSPDMEKAIVFLGKEIFLFNKSILIPISLPDFDDIVWNDSENLLLLSQKLDDNSQKLFSVKIAKQDELEIIANFERPLQDGKIVNGNSDFVLAVDNAAAKRVYKISKSKKTKVKLQIDENFKNLRLLGGILVFEIIESNVTNVFFASIAADSLNFQKIPAVSSAAAALSPLSDEKLIFAGLSSAKSEEKTISLNEALEMAKENLSGRKKYFYFIEYNIKSNSFKDLAQIEYSENERIDLMQTADKKIFFLKNNGVFVLSLSEN